MFILKLVGKILLLPVGGKLLVQIDFVKSVCYGKPF